MLALGLFADALFGLIAVVNSAIGIRQELKAKETLDRLAVLVAPKARAVRDGRLVELRGDEVVPGDVVRVEPGDQLVADGVVVSSRGLTMDESILTGESDGVRKREGDRLLSGSFCLVGSAYYEVDAVREQSHAEKVAGEARAFRHPLSPLQLEVNSVLRATDDRHGPAGGAAAARLLDQERRSARGRPDGDRRPGDPDPGGPGAADERHPRGRRRPPGADEHPGAADGGHGVAGRGRHGVHRQDRDAHRWRRWTWSRSRSPTRRSPPPPRRRWPDSFTRPVRGTEPWRRSPSGIRAGPSGWSPRCRSPRPGSGAG